MNCGRVFLNTKTFKNGSKTRALVVPIQSFLIWTRRVAPEDKWALSTGGFCVTGKGFFSRKMEWRARVLASQNENIEERKGSLFLLSTYESSKGEKLDYLRSHFHLIKYSKMDWMRKNFILSVACKRRLIEQTCGKKFSFPQGKNKSWQQGAERQAVYCAVH